MRIQSILLGLYMQDDFIDQQAKKIEKSKKKISQIYKVYDKKLLDELRNNELKNIPSKIEIHKMRIKIYYPQQFQQLRELDKDLVNIKRDFDLIENLKIANDIAETGDGGRSGQLLFFNHDNSLLMKTISSHDVESFRKISAQYFHYVTQKERNTLISKIYGMYSFTRKDARDPKTYIIFMRNIASISSDYILRRYDLKGSRHDREVLTKHKIKAEDLPNTSNIELFQSKYKLNKLTKQSIHQNNNINNHQSIDDINVSQKDFDDIICSQINKTSFNFEELNVDLSQQNWIAMYNEPMNKTRDDSNLSLSKLSNHQINVAKITLKDVDFVKLEQKVFINEDEIVEVKRILLSDSQFFKENGLIDYSLLIFKVAEPDQIPYINNNNTHNKKQKHVFQSTLEPNVFYHIGIIDYLQQWNIDKLLEQKAKQAMHANMSLNVSSQNPEAYSSRFKHNIIDSFF